MAYETITPTLIPNTTMEKYINASGVFKTYRITPNEGYVIHAKGCDYEEIDPETDEVIGIKAGYKRNTVTCAASYDFTPVQVVAANGETVTGYGVNEYYAILETEVPADQIFGAGNDHEVM